MGPLARQQRQLSAVVAAIPIPKEKTAPFRWPLLALGLGCSWTRSLRPTPSRRRCPPASRSTSRSSAACSRSALGPVGPTLLGTRLDRRHPPADPGPRRHRRHCGCSLAKAALPMVLLAALSGAVYTVTAMVIHRPRPSDTLVHVIRHTGSSSYPSGHVAFFRWFLVMLIVCLAMGRLPKAIVAVLWVIAALFLTGRLHRAHLPRRALAERCHRRPGPGPRIHGIRAVDPPPLESSFGAEAVAGWL